MIATSRGSDVLIPRNHNTVRNSRSVIMKGVPDRFLINLVIQVLVVLTDPVSSKAFVVLPDPIIAAPDIEMR